MGNGVVLQEGTPFDIYTAPQSQFVANFLGAANLLDGQLLEQSNGVGKVQTQLGILSCLLLRDLKDGDKVLVSARPEEIRVLKEKPETENVLSGEIAKLTFLGDCLECRVRVDSQMIRAKLHPEPVYREGESVFVQLPTQKTLAIPWE